MAINLVTLVSEFLTPDMIARIARALGLDSSVAGRAIEAAVPGLLGSLAGVASTPDGARKLFDTVTSQRPGTLDGLAATLGGAGKEALVQNGSSLLSALLGRSAVPQLAGAIGKYAGVNPGVASSLLGLLAPVVTGALGKQTAASGLGASGLAQLLASQKGAISAALPAGFAHLLRAAGLPGFSGAPAADAQPARAAQSSVAATSGATTAGLPGWVVWAIPLIVLAALAWWFLGHHRTEVVDQGQNTTGQAVQNANADISLSLQTTLGNLKTTLQSVTDAASAQAALPKLQDESAQLDKLDGLTAALPATARSALAALVAAARPSLDDLFNKALAIPGVAEIAKPAIDQIRAKLDALAKL